MGFNDWLYVKPSLHPGLVHADEVSEDVDEDLARLIEQKLHSSLDSGVKTSQARRVQGIRAYSEGGQIVISEDHSTVRSEDSEESSDLDSLFNAGSGVPEEVGGQLVFRQVSLAGIFDDQDEADKAVSNVCEEVVRENVVESVERAMDKAKILHIGEGK